MLDIALVAFGAASAGCIMAETVLASKKSELCVVGVLVALAIALGGIYSIRNMDPVCVPVSKTEGDQP